MEPHAREGDVCRPACHYGPLVADHSYIFGVNIRLAVNDFGPIARIKPAVAQSAQAHILVTGQSRKRCQIAIYVLENFLCLSLNKHRFLIRL